jgi:hypothetical protein
MLMSLSIKCLHLHSYKNSFITTPCPLITISGPNMWLRCIHALTRTVCICILSASSPRQCQSVAKSTNTPVTHWVVTEHERDTLKEMCDVRWWKIMSLVLSSSIRHQWLQIHTWSWMRILSFIKLPTDQHFNKLVLPYITTMKYTLSWIKYYLAGRLEEEVPLPGPPTRSSDLAPLHLFFGGIHEKTLCTISQHNICRNCGNASQMQ